MLADMMIVQKHWLFYAWVWNKLMLINKIYAFQAGKGKIQDGLVTITMPDEQGCYDLTGWIIKNPFSEEKQKSIQ